MWTSVKTYTDIRLDKTSDGIARITINRPEVRNAFRPLTVRELLDAFDVAHEDPDVGVIILTGEGDKAFCSGGDQKVRGHAGYVGSDGVPRLNVLDLQKKAREIWFLCRQYDAAQALEMGLVNAVVPLAELESQTLKWAREILQHSPLALRCLKAALNADCDGQIGLLDLAGNATLLYYMSEEAKEGKNAFVEKRRPDFRKFPRVP